MAEPPGVSVSHFGFCVSDLERSRRFYGEALGFAFSHELSFGAPFDRLTGVPGIEGRAAFLTRGSQTIELLSYSRPGNIGAAEPRAMNQLGLTHMSLVVEDIAGTAASIERHGGRVLHETRVETPVGAMMFAADPDGIRLELWEKT